MSASEYHAGWQAAAEGQPCAFGMSADWLAGYRDSQLAHGTAPRRRFLAVVPA